MARSKVTELLNSTVTLTSGEAVSVSLLQGQWHEAIYPIIVSGVNATHAVDIQVSADDSAYVPAKDLSDNVLSNITAAAVYIISGKMNYIRAFTLTCTDTSSNPLVQTIFAE